MKITATLDRVFVLATNSIYNLSILDFKKYSFTCLGFTVIDGKISGVRAKIEHQGYCFLADSAEIICIVHTFSSGINITRSALHM